MPPLGYPPQWGRVEVVELVAALTSGLDEPRGLQHGEVPSVWLLAARINYTIPNTNAVVFVSGENLTDEIYITDREDGVKPGIGRTVMVGGKYKW